MSEKPLTTDEVETIIARNLDLMGVPRPMTRQEALLQCNKLLNEAVRLRALIREWVSAVDAITGTGWGLPRVEAAIAALRAEAAKDGGE